MMEGKQGRSGPHPNDKEPQARLSRASLPPPAPPGPGSQIHPALPHQRKWWLLSQPNPGPVATDSPNWAQQPHQGHSSTLLFVPLRPQASLPLSFPENPVYNLCLGPGSTTGLRGCRCVVEKVLDRESGHLPLTPVASEQVA